MRAAVAGRTATRATGWCGRPGRTNDGRHLPGPCCPCPARFTGGVRCPRHETSARRSGVRGGGGPGPRRPGGGERRPCHRPVAETALLLNSCR
ncbi:hypothetical protein STXM2123_859 [Streptomyces sp. F-3]|nr:hypothetical protein STXM2123_859 [Streptomyces sp. F-3]